MADTGSPYNLSYPLSTDAPNISGDIEDLAKDVARELAKLVNAGSSNTFTQTNTFAQIVSSVTTGTSPFSITSTTVNTNLNADLLDGQHASAFATSTHTHGNITNDGKVGSTSGLVIKTGASGAVEALSAGSNGQFLQYNATWATPPNTTYTFDTGTTNGAFSVTPSGGSAQSVSVFGLGSAAYTASTDYAASSHTHTFTSITSKPTTLSGYGITDALDTSATAQTKDGSLTLSVTGVLTANSIKTPTGTSTQFLKADGSVDSSTYITGSSPTISTPALTLSSTSNTAEGRIAWDSINDKIVVGDGTTAKEFASSTLVQNAQTGTSYTLVLADKDKLVELSNASAITLTVPTNASVAYPVGTQINLLQTGAGQVTVAGATGGTTVTVNGTPTLKLRAQWSAATLVKRAENTWVLIGDLASS